MLLTANVCNKIPFIYINGYLHVQEKDNLFEPMAQNIMYITNLFGIPNTYPYK